jgi:putative membrane protein
MFKFFKPIFEFFKPIFNRKTALFSPGSPKKQALTQKHIKSRSFGAKYRTYRGEQLTPLQVILRLQASVFLAVLPWALLYGGYGFLVSVIHYFHTNAVQEIFGDSKVLQNVIVSFNVLLSIFLVFRTNAANERFWEARKQWGALVNTVRNLARGIWVVVEERDSMDRAQKEAMLRLVVAFAVAMKLHLRREPVNNELSPLMASFNYFKLKEVNHAPLEISFWIADYLQRQYERGYVNAFQISSLHKLLDDLVDVLGACERILKTPMPLIYTILLRTLLVIYFVLLPWDLVDGLTWWTGPITVFVSLILLGIDEVGAEIEEPFGKDPNDLPLDAICATMLSNVNDLIATAASKSLYDLPEIKPTLHNAND